MPELYEVVGAILRDVAQARFMSDLYSRHISQVYEQDSLLRRFPVPRLDVQSVEFEFKFLITDVLSDEARTANRTALMAQIHEKYSDLIVRTAWEELKSKAKEQRAQPLSKEQENSLQAFQNQFLSDDSRNQLAGRLFRYFQAHGAELVKDGDHLDADRVKARIQRFSEELATKSPELKAVMNDFKEEWKPAYASMLEKIGVRLGEMQKDVAEAAKEPGDFKLQVEVSPDKLKDQPALSSIKIVSTVKNYTWSKVDVDPQDLHNIRTLNPE